MRFNFLPSTFTLALFALFSFLLLAFGQESGQTKRPYRPNGSEATISGEITFKGEVPKPRHMKMEADPACQITTKYTTSEDAIVNHGKLANVFVYIKSGDALDFYSFESPTSSARLRDQGCRYLPHVLGVRVGQTLMISSEDPTFHNPHALPRLNQEWNLPLPQDSAPILKSFEHPEVAILMKDNQHPWERAYVGVFSHPFFATSDQRGNYRIAGLPPGHYSLAAWHERFGEQTMEITIRSGESRKIDFSFSPTLPAPKSLN